VIISSRNPITSPPCGDCCLGVEACGEVDVVIKRVVRVDGGSGGVVDGAVAGVAWLMQL
jgi:hypothetical protein